jgi:hypothetical protein
MNYPVHDFLEVCFTAVCRSTVVIDAERRFIISMVLVCVYSTNVTLECDTTVYLNELKRRLMHYFQTANFLSNDILSCSTPVSLKLSGIADISNALLTL